MPFILFALTHSAACELQSPIKHPAFFFPYRHKYHYRKFT